MIINIITIIVVFLLDQLSKIYVLKNFELHESKSVIKGLFRWTYVQNKGVAFGAFQGMIPVIIGISIIAVIGIILYLHKKREEHSNWARFGLIFIVGGAIGNLYDRIFRGYVVDFFDFYGIWHAIFNVADIAINIGIVLIVIEYFIEKESMRTNSEKKDADEKRNMKENEEEKKI
jgi:signal peptidase II